VDLFLALLILALLGKAYCAVGWTQAFQDYHLDELRSWWESDDWPQLLNKVIVAIDIVVWFPTRVLLWPLWLIPKRRRPRKSDWVTAGRCLDVPGE